MRYPPHEARVVLVDGPVSIFLHEAPEAEINASIDRLMDLVEVAIWQFNHPEEPYNEPPR